MSESTVVRVLEEHRCSVEHGLVVMRCLAHIVSGGAKAQVGGTADAVISLPETQGAVNDAHVRQTGGRARECSADGWGFIDNSVLETV